MQLLHLSNICVLVKHADIKVGFSSSTVELYNANSDLNMSFANTESYGPGLTYIHWLLSSAHWQPILKHMRDVKLFTSNTENLTPSNHIYFQEMEQLIKQLSCPLKEKSTWNVWLFLLVVTPNHITERWNMSIIIKGHDRSL